MRKPDKQPLATGTVQRVVDLALGRCQKKQPTGPADCWKAAGVSS